MFSTHLDSVEELRVNGLYGTKEYLCFEGLRQFALQYQKNQLRLLHLYILRETREIGTHMVIRKRETLFFHQDYENVVRRGSLVTQAVGAA